MISRLRKRPRLDNLRSEKRGRRNGFGRWIYLSLLLVGGVWLLDVAFGDVFFLRADGFVLRARHLAAAPYAARVSSVLVENGQRVEKGTPMLEIQVHSPEFARDVAQLSVRIADLEIRLAELKSKANVLEEVLPFAKKRAKQAREVIRVFESDLGKPHVTTNRMADALKDELEAVEQLRRVTSEHASITSKLEQLELALERAKHALEVTARVYADREIDAAVSGTVVNVRTNVGAIVQGGEPVVEILAGPSYVLAYVTPGALFNVERGERVLVRYGVRLLSGVVMESLPVAGELPPEFQRAFRPKERAQMFKVALSEGDDIPPLQTKVQILSRDSLKARVISGLSELDRVVPFLGELWVDGGAWAGSQWHRLGPYLGHLWEDGRTWARGLSGRREEHGPGRASGAPAPARGDDAAEFGPAGAA